MAYNRATETAPARSCRIAFLFVGGRAEALMTTQGMARDDAGVVDVEGAQLRYRIEGRGQPCLVVGSSIVYPRVFSQELREHLQLAFADLRHCAGVSDPSFAPDRISIDTYADDIERVRQALGLGEVVVVGIFIHGTIALEYARRYPGHVRGVVAIGAVPRGSDEYSAEGERLWAAEASEERKAILARRLAELTPEVRATLSASEIAVRDDVAYGPTKWYDPAYDCSWLWAGVVFDMPVMERLFGELFQTYDLTQGPGKITVPVLIAHGRYDYGAPYTLWEEHRHKLPRHTYALFDQSGHYPPLEEPERFDQTLLAWVHGLDEPGGG
jgi:proline iminopeptidase